MAAWRRFWRHMLELCAALIRFRRGPGEQKSEARPTAPSRRLEVGWSSALLVHDQRIFAGGGAAVGEGGSLVCCVGLDDHGSHFNLFSPYVSHILALFRCTLSCAFDRRWYAGGSLSCSADEMARNKTDIEFIRTRCLAIIGMNGFRLTLDELHMAVVILVGWVGLRFHLLLNRI